MAVLIYIIDRTLPPYPELVVEICGTYDDMIERSSSRFSPYFHARSWYGGVKSPAKFRFLDPQYGFTAPASHIVYVNFDWNIVESFSLFPQTEPLMFDEALKVALDLQDQWRAGGWYEFDPRDNPAFENTPEWRAKLRDARNGSRTYWQAEKKYQVMLTFGRTLNERYPGFKPEDQRYKVGVYLSKARWLAPRKYDPAPKWACPSGNNKMPNTAARGLSPEID